MLINSTRRKYFFDPDPGLASTDQVSLSPAPEAVPPISHADQRPAQLVGAAMVNVPRQFGPGVPPARGNGGRWRA
ncbi:hypothetical protein OG792_32165 [Micromonospora sp. NBC_01699]|uniref:hypothetical protein n=1 Tax=Micromonospora sp. NBC_01699 TaxID=2975984 RepID=UPI002E2E1B70|nr:hypothetical protein [Micromonospora sp. NBC_01699]